MRSLLTRILSITAILSFGIMLGACNPEGIVDESDFTLYYPGITDIGPSTNFNLNPTWHGDKPYDFVISVVRLDGKTYETDCFSINTESGVVSLHDTDAMPVGLYAMDIVCKSAGKSYKFENAIEVNMMKPIPDGITVKPELLSVKLEDVRGAGAELPEAAITTDGGHISIKKYKIASVLRDGEPVSDFDKLFSVSSKGVVSVIGNNPDFEPGKYTLSFRLTTFIAGEDYAAGLFENALTVDIISAPLSLEYSPAIGRVEAAYAFKSAIPAYSGSMAGLKYALKSVTPAGAPVSIDANTGEISISEGNTLTPGDIITVSITVTNAYGAKDFDDIYKIETVAYVKPVSGFEYGTIEDIYQDVAFSIPVSAIEGDYVTYSFAEKLPAELSSLSIDANTGVISAAGSNGIPLGEYNVKVKAENTKNDMIAECKFRVVKNPYYFSYVRYGNNLGLTPISDYANQFRLQAGDASLAIPVAESDIPAGQPVKWSVKKTWCKANVTIDPATGELTVKASTARMCDYATVVVTVGGTSKAAVTREIPVFFNFNIEKFGFKIQYTPFVFKCNPKTGGASAAPVITGAGFDPAKFAMDYRRTFNFFNIGGPASHINGQPSTANSFMRHIWEAYYSGVGKTVNPGAREPMSYFDKGNLSMRLGYVDQSDFSVLINPDKFKDEAGYANGVFVGQMIYGMNGGSDPAANFKKGDFPIFIWFDTAF